MNKQFVEERQKIARENANTMPCIVCGGYGFTVEYDPRDESGQTPMQAQCDRCHAEGEYVTLDDLDTLIKDTILATEGEIVKELNHIIETSDGEYGKALNRISMFISTLTPE